jgi:hypothetical protein
MSGYQCIEFDGYLGYDQILKNKKNVKSKSNQSENILKKIKMKSFKKLIKSKS